MLPNVLNTSGSRKNPAGGSVLFPSLFAEKQRWEMSSWGETQKTAGPVFGMINKSFDNGSKGKMDPFPVLFYASLNVLRPQVPSENSWFEIIKAVDEV